MKYLIKRDDFLRSVKSAESDGDFIRKGRISGIAAMNEAVSGPFENDLGWHDSLVGRFLNHLVRKAKVANNLRRIKDVIKRLEGEFDRIAAEGLVTKMDKEQNKLYIKSILYNFFWSLNEAVENGSEVKVIKNLTEVAIENLKGLKEEQVEEKTRAVLMDELEDFLKFLEQFDEKEAKQDSTAEPNEAEVLKSVYPMMLRNLQALKLILANYKKVSLLSNADTKAIEYVTKEGDTIEGIQKNLAVNKKRLTSVDILNKNQQKLSKALAGLKTPDEKIKKTLPSGIKLMLEGLFLLEDATIGEGGGKDRHKVGTGEDHLTQAYAKLKKDIEVLESSKEKGIGIDLKFLDAIILNSKNTQSKDLIKFLYSEINRYLIGDKKQTIQEKDPLYKESYEYLMPKTANNPNGGKMQVVAEKIARFAKRAMQFDGENLYGGLGDLSNPLKEFVDTMKELMKQPTIKKEQPKEGANEKAVLKYDSFISYIKEADEDIEASDPKSGMSISEKIKDYFDKNCMTVKDFTMEKSELKKVQANFEKMEEEKGNFVIDGFDPIIEILKLFNRAYKLYMSIAISKRSEGPGVSTAAEYTSFGDKGPYRNNKIFDAWESAVLDIMKNRKYQFIFDKKTMLKVGNEMRPNGGAALRKFMTDILNGEKLYKDGSSGQGAQAKLLDTYFGQPDEAAQKEIAAGTAFNGDLTENTGVQERVNESKIEIKTTKSSNFKDTVLPRSFLIVNAKDEAGKEIQRSFFIQTIDNGMVYMQYSKTFDIFQGYLDSINGGKKTMVQGDFKVNLDKTSQVLYTKVKTEEFAKMLLQPKTIEIKNINNEKKTDKEKLEVISSYWITKKDENKKDVIFTIPKESIDQLMKAIERKGNRKELLGLMQVVVDQTGKTLVGIQRA